MLFKRNQMGGRAELFSVSEIGRFYIGRMVNCGGNVSGLSIQMIAAHEENATSRNNIEQLFEILGKQYGDIYIYRRDIMLVVRDPTS